MHALAKGKAVQVSVSWRIKTFFALRGVKGRYGKSLNGIAMISSPRRPYPTSSAADLFCLVDSRDSS